MALWDQVKTMLAIQPTYDSVRPVQARTLDPGSSTLDDLLERAAGLRSIPWRAASIREAMGTPAIFRAVSLIANTTGSLTMETFRNGEKMADDETPRMVKRPDPFRTPRAFYRDGGYHLATRGELWWWIAKRDIDGAPLSLIIMPPWEVTVEQTTNRDRLRPTIKWLDREMNRDDVRLITFMPDERSPAGPFQRGVGPLQLCGAAVSVAVESTEWAANFYAGGSMGGAPIIKSATELGNPIDDPDGDNEAAIIRAQWMERDNNTPAVIDPGIENIQFPPFNEQGAQMLDARNNENGNAARMFGIPGSLLEYQQSGSSLTYQNLEGEFTKFVKACLAPGYLEPIEQEMSDLLTRSTVARFNVKGFLRADQKTRWETYQIAVAVLGQEEAATLAREQEGLTPGDVEFAPVPFAPPQAVPDQLPIQRAASMDDAHEVRCQKGHLLAEYAAPPYRFKCNKCKTFTESKPLQVRNVEQDDKLRELIEDLPRRLVEAMPRPQPVEAPSVQFHDGAFRYEAPDVTVPAPVVNLPPAEVNVAPAQVTIDLEPLNALLDDFRAEVHKSNLPKQRDVLRDEDGRVRGLTEWTIIDQEKSA